MTTLRKSEFARANGAKSRGPTTPEGKLASSQNATQHGIFFEQVLAELKDHVQRYETSDDRQFAKGQAAIQRMCPQGLLDAKDSAFLLSNSAASSLTSPRLNIHGPSAPREKVILQNEPRAQNET